MTSRCRRCRRKDTSRPGPARCRSSRTSRAAGCCIAWSLACTTPSRRPRRRSDPRTSRTSSSPRPTGRVRTASRSCCRCTPWPRASRWRRASRWGRNCPDCLRPSCRSTRPGRTSAIESNPPRCRRWEAWSGFRCTRRRPAWGTGTRGTRRRRCPHRGCRGCRRRRSRLRRRCRRHRPPSRHRPPAPGRRRGCRPGTSRRWRRRTHRNHPRFPRRTSRRRPRRRPRRCRRRREGWCTRSRRRPRAVPGRRNAFDFVPSYLAPIRAPALSERPA
jgi:hypothetical protein